MKKISSTISLIVILLVAIILSPSSLYAHKTMLGKTRLYHQGAISKGTLTALNSALRLTSAFELSNEEASFDICMSDGSFYPDIVKLLTGQAFARGFADKVVVFGAVDPERGLVNMNGWSWNLEQLMAHELTHCLQYRRYGFGGSNPVAGHANWKWEGYPEYVARRHSDQTSLGINVKRKLEQDVADPKRWAYKFSDGTISPKSYYEAWLLVQYCMDVRKMSFDQILSDNHSEAQMKEEMMNWYTSQP